MKYDDDNRGVLFRNDKTDDKQPDYKGNINVNGERFWLSAWLNTSKTGTKYMSLRLKPKEEESSKPRPDFNDQVQW